MIFDSYNNIVKESLKELCSVSIKMRDFFEVDIQECQDTRKEFEKLEKLRDIEINKIMKEISLLIE